MPRAGVAVSVRPDFEPATQVGSFALKHVVDAWRARDLEITDLAGADAVREKVLDAFNVHDPVLYFMVGHGNEDLMTGQEYDNLFWTCDCRALVGRVIVALSCVTAARLGPDAVGKGARCYIGYDKDFTWIMDVVQDPLLNLYARGFFEAVLEILYRLMAGDTTAEAYRASMDVWNYWIDYWTRSTDPSAPLVLQWLIHDRDSQKLIGDAMATVTVAEIIPALWWAFQAVGAVAPIMIVAAVLGTREAEKAGILV